MNNHKLDLTDSATIHTLQRAVDRRAQALHKEYWQIHGTQEYTAREGYRLLTERAENLLAYAQLELAYWTQSHKTWLSLECKDNAVDRASAAVRRAELAKYKAICDEKAAYLEEQRELYNEAMEAERAQRNK